MNWFEKWILQKIIRKQVRQGHDHPKRISSLYRLIRIACQEEFTEDNEPTLRAALADWFEMGWKE